MPILTPRQRRALIRFNERMEVVHDFMGRMLLWIFAAIGFVWTLQDVLRGL